MDLFEVFADMAHPERAKYPASIKEALLHCDRAIEAYKRYSKRWGHKTNV